ncbi:MAG: GlxA family transcriptional regulator [Paracoccaceae bacterium]|nr:GlxA family transcriptional regulator [Paracoccaceae bacterium]
MQKTNPRTIGLLLFPEFSNFCLANAVEPMRAANMLAGRTLYRWQHLGLDEAPIRSSSGLPVTPEARLSEHPGGNYLFVMPSYGHERLATRACHSALRAARGRFGTLVGLDTGSWLLASAGLLNGRRATSHWDILTDLAERFPEVDVTDDRFVIDGPVASCGGATTTLDLMLDLIAQHHSAPLSLEVAALFMHGERDPRLDPLQRLPDTATVRAAAALMRRHVEDPLPIPEIARRLGLSPRALQLSFARDTGAGPASLYRSIRLAEARRRVLQTRASIAEIALRCGYADATAMTRAFRAEYGSCPRGLRQAKS